MMWDVLNDYINVGYNWKFVEREHYDNDQVVEMELDSGYRAMIIRLPMKRYYDPDDERTRYEIRLYTSMNTVSSYTCFDDEELRRAMILLHHTISWLTKGAYNAE